jgi:hypothetical protein
MFISDPNYFHLGSRVKKIPGSASTSKNLSIVTPKIVSKLSEILSGMFILDFDFLPIPDSGFRGQKCTGSRIQIRNTAKEIGNR